MAKKIIIDFLGWGIGLWLFGYVLGIAFFFFIPPEFLGWAIMPFGMAVTFWVLFAKIKAADIKYYFYLALAWTAIAIVFDYIFLVKVFQPADGYYKLDVYLYYILTFVMPLAVGYKKRNREVKK